MNGTEKNIREMVYFAEIIHWKVKCLPMKKVGVFSRLINNHPAAVTFGALTVLIVISCVVVFLVFLKRRQMNKYEKY